MYTPTKRRSISFYHHWTLEHFRSFAQDQCSWKWRLCSNHFSPPNNAAFRFMLTVEKVLSKSTGETYLAVGLGPIKVPPKMVAQLEETTSVLNENDDTVYSAKHPAKELTIDSDHDKAFMMKKYLKISEFLDSTKDYLTKDGHLILYSAFTLTSSNLTDPKTTAPSISYSNLLAPVAHYSHHFSINHFSLLYRRTDCCPYYFTSNHLEQNQHLGRFCIRVYPKGISGVDEEMLAIACTNENAIALNVHCRFGLVDESGEEHFRFNINMKQLPQWTVQTAVPRAEILDPASSYLLPEDMLIICCELHVIDDSQASSKTNQIIPTITNSISTVNIAQNQIYYGTTTWKIKKFLKQIKKETSLTSPLFGVGSYFAFSIMLNTEIEPKKGYYSSLRLWSAKSADEETTIQYCIKIISSDGKAAICFTNQETILAYGEYGRRRLLSRSAFKSMAKYLVPNDTLTVTCQIWLFTKRNCPIDRLYQRQHSGQSTTGSALFCNSTITNSIITTNGQLNMGHYTVNEDARKASTSSSESFSVLNAHDINPKRLLRSLSSRENATDGWLGYIKANAQLMDELIELL